MIRNISELSQLLTREERFEYLRLSGIVGDATFGFERYVNQRFYTSTEWRRVRQIVIARDEGCDMGLPGWEIYDRPIIHHMNPMEVQDIVAGLADILNPDYLITVSLDTHNAIHYGNRDTLAQPLVERRPGDTKLWGRG